MADLRVLHWNVFEDGLTDAPGSIGLGPEFVARASELLAALSSDERAGRCFVGFRSARDFSQLPAVGRLDSPMAVLAVLDVVYCAVYHSLGGEARLEQPEGPIPLGKSLRGLFLHTRRRPDGQWFAGGLEQDLGQAEHAGPLRELARAVLDPGTGRLSWPRAVGERIWKRRDNVWRDKWAANLACFRDLPPELAYFCQPGGLVDPEWGADGTLEAVRTLGLQPGLLLLLERLCAHNPAAGPQIAKFLAIAPESVPASAAERAALLLPEFCKEVEEWSRRAGLGLRHRRVTERIAGLRPDIAHLVEYDPAWRRLPLAQGYTVLSGAGQASIAWRADRFSRLTELAGVEVSDRIGGCPGQSDGAVRAMAEQCGWDLSKLAPKSSCVALLEDRLTGRLVLAAAIHLESAKPSDTPKVLIRRQQLRATLSQLAAVAQSVRPRGCLVLLAGDLNAIREEFALGTGQAFFDSPGARAIQPALRRPVPGPVAVEGEMLEPAIARLGQDGGLRLRCDGVDGGELREGSMAAGCTRAGAQAMVIDFILVGTVGGQLTVAPHAVASPAEVGRAADGQFGVRAAVLEWGSDHLPVCCDVLGPEDERLWARLDPNLVEKIVRRTARGDMLMHLVMLSAVSKDWKAIVLDHLALALRHLQRSLDPELVVRSKRMTKQMRTHRLKLQRIGRLEEVLMVKTSRVFRLLSAQPDGWLEQLEQEAGPEDYPALTWAVRHPATLELIEDMACVKRLVRLVGNLRPASEGPETAYIVDDFKTCRQVRRISFFPGK